MSKLIIDLVLIVLLLTIVGCSSQLQGNSSFVPSQATTAPNVLTAEKAQTAVDTFVSRNGSGKLRIRGGVREVPSENSAVAELALEDFQSGNRVYQSGKWNGQAIFSKYSDGRWSLTKIHLRNPSDYAWQSWDPVIEVH